MAVFVLESERRRRRGPFLSLYCRRRYSSSFFRRRYLPAASDCLLRPMIKRGSSLPPLLAPRSQQHVREEGGGEGCRNPLLASMKGKEEELPPLVRFLRGHLAAFRRRRRRRRRPVYFLPPSFPFLLRRAKKKKKKKPPKGAKYCSQSKLTVSPKIEYQYLCFKNVRS